MGTLIADNTDSLLRALKLARDGDTILLQANIYSNISIKNLKIDGDVTIASKDPNNPAIFTDLKITNSEGLNFRNIEVHVQAERGSNPVNISKSSDIHFDHLNVHGSLDGDPSNDTSAILFQDASDISVTNSEFQQLANGVAHLDSFNVKISGNSFHDIRMDGIRGGGSSQVTITNNHFTDFYRNAGDHPDAIQFWTTGTTNSAHDILISGNIIVRGAGTPFQGIFLRDESNGELPYHHVEITDNIVLGGMYQGIAVLGGENILFANNVVGGFQDMTSWIRAQNVNGLVMLNNKATSLPNDTTVTGKIASDNITIQAPLDSGMDLLQQWYSNHGVVSSGSTMNPALDLANWQALKSITIDAPASLDQSHLETTTTYQPAYHQPPVYEIELVGYRFEYPIF